MPSSDSSPPALTIYRPNQRHETSWLETLVTMARNVWGARELILQLCKRDLIAQYKKSHVGVLWMLAGPIMAVIPWLFAAKVRVYNPGEVEIPLTVYLIVGRAMWSAFSNFYNNGNTTLGSGGALLMQIHYPHEAMLIKQVLVGLVGFALQLCTCFVIMYAMGVYPGWSALLFPLTLLPLFFLGAAIGLLVGMIKVVAYDLDRIIGILWGFAMWTTPLLYSDINPPHPVLRMINEYNPLSYLVCTCRDVLVHGRFYNDAAGVYFACAGFALLLFLICLRLFHVSEQKLVERMI